MILITGATGTVGRPLVGMLDHAGVGVRAVTRDMTSARFPAAVEVIQAEPSEPETLRDALVGVTAIFVNPRAVGAAGVELIALAREQGVKRMVTMSALNVEFDVERQPSRLRGEYNKEVEFAVVESGLEWVALRSGAYADNAIAMWAGQIRAGEVVRGAYPNSTWAPIHEHDIAAVGAHALLTDGLLGRRPVLTGPHSLTQPNMVTAIGAAIGRSLRFEEISPDAATQAMIRAGIPTPLAEGFLTMQAESYGQRGLVSNEVEEILRRPARTFAEWAVDHVDSFR
ncbi:NAD(P)H-binding protein [Nocardia jinanensis]|uniref:Nucleotide-diphosphate-sugar epimerase n=1 Tax=Nocardia jinanensis TaxID=382504 RepID=A0A917S0M6_9NOCA|nr:NAD(P)H-binding protein [Nocardia jinanensis]GGL47165.1 nucleotide-diphosphate-sugar epimerase [Nocardia jinanensis]